MRCAVRGLAVRDEMKRQERRQAARTVSGGGRDLNAGSRRSSLRWAALPSVTVSVRTVHTEEVRGGGTIAAPVCERLNTRSDGWGAAAAARLPVVKCYRVLHTVLTQPVPAPHWFY
ncbi:hypothetical protein J6590_055873 [Homalodisca vitripennis]|nr:hypothetical protein J6590_055873 [Homalodisca vitripennis]